MRGLKKHLGTIFVAIVVAAVMVGGPTIAAVYDANNADKVDGKHAVGSGVSASKAANKLVAHAKNGKLPAKFIPKVNSAKNADSATTAGTAATAASASDLACTAECVGASELEAGAKSYSGQTLLSGATTSSSPTQLDTFTVTPPADGHLHVTVFGRYWMNNDSTSAAAKMSSAFLGLCDTTASGSTCDGTWSDWYYEDPDNTTSLNEVPAFTLERVVPVTGGVSRTFYVNGATDGGGWNLTLYPKTRAMVIFVPSSLTVTSP